MARWYAARRSWTWCGTSTGSDRRRPSTCTCRGSARSWRTTRPTRPTSRRAAGSGSCSRRRSRRNNDRRPAMRVRGRLMLAFGYLLLVVIVALEVPLAISLRNRSLAEQRAQETTLSVATASQARTLLDQPDALQRQVRAQARANRSRVIVVDDRGRLVADSAGTTLLGSPYATPDRPEIVGALRDGQVSFRVGFSDTLRQEIQAVAAPITR